jgi:hypothetical protein
MFYSLIQLQKKFDRNFFFLSACPTVFWRKRWIILFRTCKMLNRFLSANLRSSHLLLPNEGARRNDDYSMNQSFNFYYTYNTVSWSSLEFDLVLPSFRFQFSFVLIECFKQIFCLHSLVLVSKTFPSFLVCHKVYTLGAICYYILTTIKKFKISEMFYL